jgi:hypothetical protein
LCGGEQPKFDVDRSNVLAEHRELLREPEAIRDAGDASCNDGRGGTERSATTPASRLPIGAVPRNAIV